MLEKRALFKLSSQTFFLTLTNPATIPSFVGIFASIGGSDIQLKQSIWMVVGIFLGSMTWWIMLDYGIIRVKAHLPERWIHSIRYASALILGGFGVWAIVSTFTS